MKVDDKDLPSSSGVSDGEEEEDEEDSSIFSISPTFPLRPPLVVGPSPRDLEEKCSPLSVYSAGDSSLDHEKAPANVPAGSNEISPKALPSSKCCDAINSPWYNSRQMPPCITTDVKNSYVFVTTDGDCSYADIHQTSSTYHVCGGDAARDYSEQGNKQSTESQTVNFDNDVECDDDRRDYRRASYSSEDSEGDRDDSSNDPYEGSEENDEDEYVRNRVFEKSRFNHYQKLLKEHEFVEGGDEEEYLRFLYHRHLYYNQLQKISPKNIKLFRRLEEMQNARFNSSDSFNSPLFDPMNSNKSDSKLRKLSRKGVKSGNDLDSINSKVPYPRVRSFSRWSSSHTPSRLSKSPHHRGGGSRSHSTCSTSTFAHLDNFLTIPFLLLAFLSFLLVVESVSGCRLSEFTCGNYDCIRADAYCDGEADCADRSDEPRDCTREYKSF